MTSPAPVVLCATTPVDGTAVPGNPESAEGGSLSWTTTNTSAARQATPAGSTSGRRLSTAVATRSSPTTVSAAAAPA